MPVSGGVLVSGASSGIGEATVTLLARSGYTVFAGVRKEADAVRLRVGNEKVRPLIFDVTNEAAIAAAIHAISDSGVPLVGVVSNAGIALGGPLEYLPTDALRRQFEVNVFGAMAVVRLALPQLQPGGRVIFVGSIAGRLAVPYLAPYSASKFALRAIADALRNELYPAGIPVILIEPGSVNTPIWKKGRESRGRVAALLGTGARPHYYRALERVMHNTEVQERESISPNVVAEAIGQALRAKKPRARYLVGSAQPTSLVALLPAALRDRILRASQRV